MLTKLSELKIIDAKILSQDQIENEVRHLWNSRNETRNNYKLELVQKERKIIGRRNDKIQYIYEIFMQNGI